VINKKAARPKAKGLSELLQSPINAAIFRNLPPGLSRAYLGLLGRLYFWLAAKEAEAVRFAQAHCLSGRLYEDELERCWRKTIAGIIDHYHEKLLIGFRPFPQVRDLHLNRVQVTGLKLLEEALALKRGAILVTGHYGAVELIPGALAFRGFPVTAMVHCKTQTLKRKLEERSARAGVSLLDPKSEPILFSALERLRQGQIIVTQCDEFDTWRPYADRKINFLGLELRLDRSVQILIKKSDAPVLFGLNHRLGRRRYNLVVERPEEHPAAQGLEPTSAQCLAVLGHNIYSHPEAWYEWKKLRPFVERAVSGRWAEDRGGFRLPGQVAVQSSGRT